MKSRMLGAALATSDIAAGARSLFARARAGVAVIQNYADPSVGLTAIEELKTDKTARENLETLLNTGRGIAWRQILIIDHRGDTAHYSGLNCRRPYRHASGTHCIAAGNLLGKPEVPQACVAEFETHFDYSLGERLLRALEAGLNAGGERNPLRSAALQVVHREEWPLIDLRVDYHLDPIAEIRKAWKAFEPEAMGYVNRAVDPLSAPPQTFPEKY